MRARYLVVLGVGVLVAGSGAALVTWQRGTSHTAEWVVADVRDGQRALLVDWVTKFGPCAERPVLKIDERKTEILVRATYRKARGISCGQTNGRIYPPATVHLARPLAGRAIRGTGQATVPVPWARSANGVMPSLIGMDAAAARKALSRARYRDEHLPPAKTVGSVVKHSPSAGAALRFSRAGGGAYVSGPPPHLTFEK